MPVTITRSRKRKLQKKYGSILHALRVVYNGVVRPSQLAQTPEQMWRKAEDLHAILQRPPVTPLRVCAQVADDPTQKVNFLCCLDVPPRQDPQTSRHRPSLKPERRRDPYPSRRRPSPKPDRRREPLPQSRRRQSSEAERRRELPPSARQRLFATLEPEPRLSRLGHHDPGAFLLGPRGKEGATTTTSAPATN